MHLTQSSLQYSFLWEAENNRTREQKIPWSFGHRLLEKAFIPGGQSQSNAEQISPKAVSQHFAIPQPSRLAAPSEQAQAKGEKLHQFLRDLSLRDLFGGFGFGGGWLYRLQTGFGATGTAVIEDEAGNIPPLRGDFTHSFNKAN